MEEPKLVKRHVEEEYEFTTGHAKGRLTVKNGFPYGVSIGLSNQPFVFNIAQIDDVINCLQRMKSKGNSLTRESCTHPHARVRALTRVGTADDSWSCDLCDSSFREHPSPE